MRDTLFKFLNFIEKYACYVQGKGYGAGTVEKEVEVVLELCKTRKIKTAVDVGGNVGNYSQCLLKSIDDVEIHIFEPSEKNFKILTEKYVDNPRVFLYKLALSDVSSQTQLYADKSGSGLASLTKRDLSYIGLDFEFSENVETVRFDNFWDFNAKNNVVDVIKIDVEGHEINVLNGLGDFVFQVKAIQFEFGGCNIATKTYFKDLWDFFESKEFVIFRVTPIGSQRIYKYMELDERFVTTNYVAVNSKY